MRNFWPGRPEWLREPSQRLFFDPCCMLCARRGQSGIDLCESCQNLLTTRFSALPNGGFSELCLGCGAESHFFGRSVDPTRRRYCRPCAKLGNPLLSSVVAPYRYAFPLDGLIQRMKYQSDRTVSRVFGTLMANAVVQQRLPSEYPDFLFPMPLHPNRLRQRGYNQSQDIARWCAQALKLDVNEFAARRIVDTPSLAGFGRAERQHHILGAFQAANVVLGKHVAIVDDVLTTGASARELARELYDTGAESVELWVLARTSRPRASS